MEDIIYTPQNIASELIESLDINEPKIIIDNAAGDGALLKTAAVRWPNAELVGFDIDPTGLQGMRRSPLISKVHRRDALSENSRSRIFKTCGALGRADLAVINPPFSGVGHFDYYDEFNGILIKGSKAGIFLLDALLSVKVGGYVAAILPEGFFHRRNDSSVRAIIDSMTRKISRKSISLEAFKDVSASTFYVILQRVKPKRIRYTKTTSTPCSCNVYRGNVENSSVKHSRVKGNIYIHTTHLKAHQISSSIRVIKGKVFEGPSILLPRVCRPTKEKVVYLEQVESFIASNCVIVIQAKSNSSLKEIYMMIVNNWRRFSKCYRGTGAKSITIESVKRFIGQ